MRKVAYLLRLVSLKESSGLNPLAGVILEELSPLYTLVYRDYLSSDVDLSFLNQYKFSSNLETSFLGAK